jgi:hypothetical protein
MVGDVGVSEVGRTCDCVALILVNVVRTNATRIVLRMSNDHPRGDEAVLIVNVCCDASS